MAGANSNIQITDLDFDSIKSNLKKYLKSQDTFKDYNFEGSGLSTLLDVLAYNTQYNAFYLNMVANEMFLDTAIQRGSVVSHAKSLGYTPKSALAPTANVNISVSGVTDPDLIIPRFTKLMSESIDGINYTFVTMDEHRSVTNLTTEIASFDNIQIKQGIPASSSLVVDNSTNPKSLIVIPESNVDTTTLEVTVYQSSQQTTFETYTLADNYLSLDGSSTVYFVQENMNGNYELYFGDGILGKKLTDGNIVLINYLTSSGSAAASANSFVMMDNIGGYANITVTPITPASQGALKESIDSIKFHAPKAFATQKRAVSKEDYITAIQNNNLGYSFDAVNVWGGEENDPPVYGQVMVSIKPTNAYNITQTQKQRLALDVIKPISMMTVVPTFVDPDYTYTQITANVLYDAKKTNLSANQLQNAIKSAISTYGQQTLNTFNSSFSTIGFNEAIKSVSGAIITNEIDLKLQKKFYPAIGSSASYTLHFGVPLQRGMFQSGVTSKPAIQFRDLLDYSKIVDNVFIEEVPSYTGGIQSLSITNPGYSYTSAPTVTIKGDGTGATAYATINSNGSLREVIISSAGTGYTSAIAVITNATGDTTGQSGAVSVTLEGRYGTLRSYYNDSNNVKTVFNDNIGTIDYETGLVTLNSFSPVTIDDPLGQLTVSAKPTSTIISSNRNRILTLDPFDPNAIIVNVTAKT